jgi:hypothetical protein
MNALLGPHLEAVGLLIKGRADINTPDKVRRACPRARIRTPQCSLPVCISHSLCFTAERAILCSAERVVFLYSAHILLHHALDGNGMELAAATLAPAGQSPRLAVLSNSRALS